jgi:hypothetical protein
VGTTSHPAQKFPVLGHFQLDASSSLIPAPKEVNRIVRHSLKQGSW